MQNDFIPKELKSLVLDCEESYELDERTNLLQYELFQRLLMIIDDTFIYS